MKVECIKAFSKEALKYDEILPVVGQVYTVRDVTRVGDYIGYRFVEIRNPQYPYNNGMVECAFFRGNFRPVTDISALVKLTKVREVEGV